MLPIRIRLTVWYVVIFSITLVLFSFFLFVFISHRIIKDTDMDMLAEAKECRSIFLEEIAKPSFEELDEELKGINYYLQIYSIDGKLLYTSANLYQAHIPVDTQAYSAIEHDNYMFRTVSVFRHMDVRTLLYPIVMQGAIRYYLIMGVSLNEQKNFLSMLGIILTIVTPVVILVASWGGIVIAGRAMKPVDDIIETVRRIEAGNLDEQITVKTRNDEIGKLARTFNDMLLRLKKAFYGLAHFSQNVSHELKTPLTVMKSGIEINIIRDRSAADYRELLVSLLEEVDQMTRIIDDLLLTSLSRTESLQAAFTRVNVSQLILQTIDFLGILASDKMVLFEHSVEEGLSISGNERLLKRAFSNIIDNAIKFTPAGKRVFVSAARHNGTIVVDIADQGPGIARDEADKIFDRFYRGNAAPADGHGLGLSIVKWIVELHSGTISFMTTADGTDFRIRFLSVEDRVSESS